MRKLVLLLLCCLTLSVSAQQRRVRVVTLSGSAYEGVLEEFKVFEYVLIGVDGRTFMIPYDEMAYIDDAKPVPVAEEPKVVETPKIVETPKVVETPQVVETPKVAETPEVVDIPKVADTPKPVNATSKVPAKASAKPALKASKSESAKAPAKKVDQHRSTAPVKRWVSCTACSHNPGVCQTCFGIGKTVDGQICMSCHGSKKCHHCEGRGGHYLTVRK